MPSFPSELARAFARMAHHHATSGDASPEDQQAVAYASRVSIEQSLKSALERAGYTEKEIRGHSHKLATLLIELGECTVTESVTAGRLQAVSASRLRSKTIHWKGGQVTLGDIIDSPETSTFPAEYRYGKPPTDYPAEVLSIAAQAVADWVAEHWDSLARRQ